MVERGGEGQARGGGRKLGTLGEGLKNAEDQTFDCSLVAHCSQWYK